MDTVGERPLRISGFDKAVLAAYERGIASCIVARGEETFDSPEGQMLLRKWGVPNRYVCRCFVLLGYAEEKITRQSREKVVESSSWRSEAACYCRAKQTQSRSTIFYPAHRHGITSCRIRPMPNRSRGR